MKVENQKGGSICVNQKNYISKIFKIFCLENAAYKFLYLFFSLPYNNPSIEEISVFMTFKKKTV